jgi:nucleoside-diphosphate-sugar epimerase
MRALVTGGGGFLGGAIVRRLLDRGIEVRSFSRKPHESLTALGVEQRQGDLDDMNAVMEAVEGCDPVFHVAAKAGVWGPFALYYRPNVIGTQYVLQACRLHGVRRLVYTSTPSVVFAGHDIEGGNESLPYPKRFETHYAATKATAEQLVLNSNGPDLATVALRPHLIWGPGDNHLLPRLYDRARKGQLRRVGIVPKRVDTIYVDNAADAHLQAFDRLAPGAPPAGRAYFISQGEPTPLWELIDRLLAAAGLPPVRRTISPGLAYAAGWTLETVYALLSRPEEPRMTRFLARQLSTAHWFDISAARRDLGYSPAVSTEEGLRRLAESLQGEPGRSPAARG